MKLFLIETCGNLSRHSVTVSKLIQLQKDTSNIFIFLQLHSSLWKKNASLKLGRLFWLECYEYFAEYESRVDVDMEYYHLSRMRFTKTKVESDLTVAGPGSHE